MFHVICWFALASFGATALAEQNVIWPLEKRLEFLRRHYSATESSHFVDLWESQNLVAIAAAGGLRDTRTLFINSHGREIRTTRGKRYILHPHERLIEGAMPVFYVEDFARLLGPTNAAQIHNLVLSACNIEGALDLRALRAAFVNVTNVIHMPAGAAGYQPMLFQALLSESSRIETLYELPVKQDDGSIEYEISSRATRGAKKLSPYIASIFTPGETRPRVQVAGRELLASFRSLTSASEGDR